MTVLNDVSFPVTEQYLRSPFPFLSLFFQKEYSLQPKCPSGSGKPGSGGSGECRQPGLPHAGLCEASWERLGLLFSPGAAETLGWKTRLEWGIQRWDVERSKMWRGENKRTSTPVPAAAWPLSPALHGDRSIGPHVAVPVRAPMGAGAWECGWYLHPGDTPQLPLSPSSGGNVPAHFLGPKHWASARWHRATQAEPDHSIHLRAKGAAGVV